MSVTQPIPTKTILHGVFALVLCALSCVAHAKDYKVEVLVFKNLNPSRVTESHNYQEPRKLISGSSTWPLEPSMLLSQANALKESSDYELLHYFSWGQESLRYASSATFSVTERDVYGAIKVYADSLLFANLDLDYDGYRMNEKRRLKLNERHFFDHPKFGILLQVSRLEKPLEPEVTEEAEEESSDTSESEPALKLESSR